MLWALGQRGRRITEDAVAAFTALERTPDSLKHILTELWQQKEGARKYLSLLLEHVYTDPEMLTKIVRELNSHKGSERKAAVDSVLQMVVGASRDIVERMSAASGTRTSGGSDANA